MLQIRVLTVFSFYALLLGLATLEAQPRLDPGESDRRVGGPAGRSATEQSPGAPDPRQIDRSIQERLSPSEGLVITPKGPSQTVTFVPGRDAAKWMPDALPARMSLESSQDEAKGSIYFSAQPAIKVQDLSYRPSGMTEAKEVKFVLTRAKLPITLPAAMTKVSLETPGNYVVLPAHTVYSMYTLAAGKKDFDVSNALEQVISKLPPKGIAVYAWSERKLEFVMYGDASGPAAKYRGSVALTENVAELTSKINAVLAGYYWTTFAKFASSPGEREQLKALATTVLPRELVEQYMQAN